MAKLISNTYMNGEVTSRLYSANNEADAKAIDAIEGSIAYYPSENGITFIHRTEYGWGVTQGPEWRGSYTITMYAGSTHRGFYGNGDLVDESHDGEYIPIPLRNDMETPNAVFNIVINGEEYSGLTAHDVDNPESASGCTSYIGNALLGSGLGLGSSEDTGEPFLIIWLYDGNFWATEVRLDKYKGYNAGDIVDMALYIQEVIED